MTALHRIGPLLLLVAANACSGPPSPDGAPVWSRAFSIEAGGEVTYQARRLREPGEPWEARELAAKLSMIARTMEEVHFNAEAGTGPTFPGGWLLVRVEDDVRFDELWPFLELCLSRIAGIGKIVFARRDSAGEEREWACVRVDPELLEDSGFHVDLAEGPYPRWTVVADEGDPSRVRHVFDLVGRDLRIESESAAELAAHPAVRERGYCSLRCGPSVRWRDLRPALEATGEWPFPVEIPAPATPEIWDQLRGGR